MPKLLKDLYNKKLINSLSKELIKVHPSFDETAFSKRVFGKTWREKELKQRMRHISETLHEFLPGNYRKAIDVLMPVSEQFSGFEYMFFQDYVEIYGMDDFDASIPALEHFTQYASSEFSVRPFIIKYPEKMMRQMEKWAKSKNHHVRRLASEGCRPRLPWAMALPEFKDNPLPVLKVIEKLKNDESEYVRRSVANNLNDISKDQPAITLKIAKAWKGDNENTDRLVKHACRTLLKSSDQQALRLFGYGNPKSVELHKFKLTKKVTMGNKVEFSFNLKTSRKSLGRLRIEYAINFVRSREKSGRKVFKISEGDYLADSKQVSKYYSFKPISTRRYYPGIHVLSILINGKEMASSKFNLSPA